MTWQFFLGRAAVLFAGSGSGQDSNSPTANDTKYLPLQSFTNFTTNPRDARTLSNRMNEPLVHISAASQSNVMDVKQEVGTVGFSIDDPKFSTGRLERRSDPQPAFVHSVQLYGFSANQRL
jgi:hypothetical protein